MVGVILCGGKSSRMHTNKALLPFGNVSLITHQYLKLSSIFQYVLISCKPSQKHIIYSTLHDDFKKLQMLDSSQSLQESVDSISFLLEDESIWTPINGILCALDWLDSPYNTLDSNKVFIVSCDCPFVTKKTIQILTSHCKNYDVTYAEDSAHSHPLVAVWNKTTKDILKKSLHKNDKINHLLSSLHTKSIYFESSEFFNINNKNDYKQALKLLEQK